MDISGISSPNELLFTLQEKNVFTKERKGTMISVISSPFTQYCFKLRAFTEGDESPYSDIVTIITEEGGTSSAHTDLITLFKKGQTAYSI